jgi:hypothetical protein
VSDAKRYDTDYLYFLSAIGECFCEAFGGVSEFAEAAPQDWQEVLYEALGSPLSPERLHAACSDEGVTQISVACQDYFEVSAVPAERIRQALERSLFRWPLGSLNVAP